MFKKKKITQLSPLRTGVRKGVAVLFIIIIFVTMFVVPVSAYNVSAFTMTFDKVTVVRLNPYLINLDGLNSSYVENETGISVSMLNANGFNQDEDYYAEFWFTSSGGRGTLNIDVIMEYCDVYQSLYYNNGGYNINAHLISYDGTILSNSSSAKNGIKFNYTGYVPDYFYLRVPFRVVTSAGADKSTFFNIAFAPYSGSSDVIANAEDNTSEILSGQNQISAEIQANQDKNSSDIQANNDKNTDKIIENDKQLQENEKNEANSSGSGGMDDLGNAIPNYSDDFIGSMRRLISCITHNYTIDYIDFPGIVIPSIGGLFDEIVLVGPCKILYNGVVLSADTGDVLYYNENFSLYLEELTVIIRIVLSIALYLFCVYELYDLIEYILTLRKGSN